MAMYKASYLMLLATSLSAATRYAALNGAHIPPFDTWAGAATNIQAAVDASSDGETVIVSNGVYATGTRATPGYVLPNRVCVTQSIILASLSGPAVTAIVGAPDPGTGACGEDAIRGVYMDAGWLIGFTVSNGFTRTSGHSFYEACGGGVFAPSALLRVSNCVISACGATVSGGGLYAYKGTATACRISGCASTFGDGGGVAEMTLVACDLVGNSTEEYGGGASRCRLHGCTVMENRAEALGGGMFGCYANECVVAGNLAGISGGGVAGDTYSPGTHENCIITGNVARLMGGGMYRATVRNCAFSGNRAWFGGGTSYGTLYNCTVTGNRGVYGGGTHHGNIYNSIVYCNDGSDGVNYFYLDSMRYSCTWPYVWGQGNISNQPQLASAWHLADTSPCVAAGSNAYSSGMDIDGEAWNSPPSMGCDEVHVGAVTGELHVSIAAGTLQPPQGYAAEFTAEVVGRATRSVWDFDDGTGMTNRPWTSKAWNTLGPRTVTLRAYNESHPAGVETSVVVTVIKQPVHYVDAANVSSPAWPYTNWVTAATNIQDAVDAAQAGSLVLVQDGVYRRGGGPLPWSPLSNRVMLTRDVTLRSVNGPAVTVIEGSHDPATHDLGEHAVRGVWMDAGQLIGFTVSNGHTSTTGTDYLERSGGGIAAWGVAPFISNCVVVGCGAANAGGGISWGTARACDIRSNHSGYSSGGSGTGSGGGSFAGPRFNCTLRDNRTLYAGGGAAGGTLEHCLLSGNEVTDSSFGGGGAFSATLNACIVVSNSAQTGGAAEMTTLNACTVMFNRAEYGGGLDYQCTANDCVIASNVAEWGGGANASTLNRCTLAGNVASNTGGGAYNCTVDHCTIRGNEAAYGGGAWGGNLINSLVVGNSATEGCGGAFCASYRMLKSCTIVANNAPVAPGVCVSNGSVYNCIIYLNGETNWMGYGVAECCCTVPPVSGPGNITNYPDFINAAAGNYRLFDLSPCVDAGSNAYVDWATDLDGDLRIRNYIVDMGCYEAIPEPCGGAAAVLALLWAARRSNQ